MKAIIQCYTPKEIERIARGEQTIKVCKTAPKDTPFKVYMYMTKKGKQRFTIRSGAKGLAVIKRKNGKIVGDYVCERVTEHEICDSGAVVNYWAEGLQHSCLTISQIDEYVGKRSSADYYKKSKISALHISAVKFYDNPKELGEFVSCKHCHNGECFMTYKNDCVYREFDLNKDGSVNIFICTKRITRPPQSWCYVEEI